MFMSMRTHPKLNPMWNSKLQAGSSPPPTLTSPPLPRCHDIILTLSSQHDTHRSQFWLKTSSSQNSDQLSIAVAMVTGWLKPIRSQLSCDFPDGMFLYLGKIQPPRLSVFNQPETLFIFVSVSGLLQSPGNLSQSYTPYAAGAAETALKMPDT